MSKNLETLSARAARYIRKHSLISDRDRVLAAVSGGPDSLALLSILVNLKDIFGIERITVVHFDHMLRGNESDEDREFVRALALSTGLDFHHGAADVRSFAQSRKISIEMAARERRRFFLQKTAAALNAQKIALGHTLNDQAEEVLLRILRGAGPSGIQAMAPSTADGFIRPLLFAARGEVLEYLREHGIAFRNDSSNLDPSHRRNFLRLKVFPLLQEAFHPHIAETIARCADLAREEESWWASHIEGRLRGVGLEFSENGAALDLKRLSQLHPVIVRRILRSAVEKVRGSLSGVGLVHLEAVVELVFSGTTGKSVRLPGGFEAVRHGAKLLLRPIKVAAPKDRHVEATLVPGPGNYCLGQYRFEIGSFDRNADLTPPFGADCIRMDADKLNWPLELRFPRPGDRFHPLGMTGSKKLQDFFVDCKVVREDRQKVPLLCDSEKICWVAGMRIDDRVKVEDHTRVILIVRLFRLSGNGEIEVSQKCSEIVQLIESADELFKKIENRGEEATRFWNEGIERLAAAIWICERDDKCDDLP
jgi:tRNA(Ile)-lysidine synthase